MTERKAPGLVDYGLLIALALIWGSAFLLSKIAVDDVSPLTLTLLRQMIAVIALGLAVVATGRLAISATAKDWLLMLATAFTGTALPFSLINWGVQEIDSGLAAILMGLMPLVVLVLAHFFTQDEKMTWPKFAGVVLGIVGLIVLFWPVLVGGALQSDIMRQLAVLAASISYGVNALVVKKLLHHPPLVLMTYVSALSVVLLLPIAFLYEEPLAISLSAGSFAAILALGLFSSALGAIVMFALIERQGASFFGQINLLVPVAGVLMGVIFLAERPGLNALLALIIIVFGVVLARIKAPITPMAAKRTLS